MLAPRGWIEVKEQEFQGNFCTTKRRRHIDALLCVVVHYLRPALSVAVALVTGWLIKRRSSMRSVPDHRRITGEQTEHQKSLKKPEQRVSILAETADISPEIYKVWCDEI